MQKPRVNKEWFEQKLAERKQSMRGLATHMGLDVSAVSRTFSGARKMQLSEAQAIAQFLQAPVSEVLRQAGMAVDLDGQPTRILLAATVDAGGKIERLKEAKPLPQSVIDRAQAAIRPEHGSILAAQIMALNGPLMVLDDAVVLFRATDGVEPAAIGALSICRTFDGEQILAKIERARKTGEARVILTSGKVREFRLHTATPILAILP